MVAYPFVKMYELLWWILHLYTVFGRPSNILIGFYILLTTYIVYLRFINTYNNIFDSYNIMEETMLEYNYGYCNPNENI